ncbi:MAG: hypothetical protein IJC68_02585, partial [Firmicutes bacterium]|nr:hypothetical protein [Bacillota bacterium]
MHNVLNSSADYPVLMRRPWNQQASGMLAVNTYDEFLKVVEVIAESYSTHEVQHTLKEPGIVVLVGPSGSGKTTIAGQLLEQDDSFRKLVSYTTKDHTAKAQNLWYNYVSLKEFHRMCETGEMFQSTMYAGHGYGSRKADVEEILARGKHVLTTMDICGAMSLKTNFQNVITIYLKREKKTLMTRILSKNTSVEDKVNRLMAMDAEKQNITLCDYAVEYKTLDQAFDQIADILNGLSK